MLVRTIGALLCSAHAVLAFRDASPFFLLSTEPLSTANLQSTQISTAAIVGERLYDSLAGCSASLYILIQQPSLRATDFREGEAMRHMRERIESRNYRGIVQIPEVVGTLNAEEIAGQLSRNCGIERTDLRDYFASDDRTGPAVLSFESPDLPSSEPARAEVLGQVDGLLEHQLSSVLANHTSHVLIYTSSPPSKWLEENDVDSATQHESYEMDEPLAQAAMHTDLKRHVGSIHARQNDNPQAGLPLFEQYQFLSPAIFMGLSVSILLLVILNVGISAIANLEVSYMAFSKEMGPQAQQKGKQQ